MQIVFIKTEQIRGGSLNGSAFYYNANVRFCPHWIWSRLDQDTLLISFGRSSYSTCFSASQAPSTIISSLLLSNNVGLPFRKLENKTKGYCFVRTNVAQ